MSDEVGIAEETTAVTDPGRTRRPSSLRSVAASGEAVSSEAASSVSGAASSEPAPGEAALAGAQRPKLTPPSFLRRDAKPEAQDAGPSPSQKLATLVSERPEVGVGIAFAAGLVVATILKRLAH